VGSTGGLEAVAKRKIPTAIANRTSQMKADCSEAKGKPRQKMWILPTFFCTVLFKKSPCNDSIPHPRRHALYLTDSSKQHLQCRRTKSVMQQATLKETN
jgi:hypothetical protein